MPSQVAVAFAGAAHGVHELVPHEAVLELLAQAPPHTWKPTLHEKPHDVPLQVADEFAGGAHGVHDDVPQEFVLELLTHSPAHR